MPTVSNILQRIALIVTGAKSQAELIRPVMNDTVNVATSFYSANTNPSAANDNTQNYRAGSLGRNTDTGRYFICRDATTGAAVWEGLTDDSLYSAFTLSQGGMVALNTLTAFARATISGLTDEAEIRLPANPYLSKTVDIIIIGAVTTSVTISNSAAAGQYNTEPFADFFCVRMVCTNATTNTWVAINQSWV